MAIPVILLLAVGVAVSLRAWPFFVQRRPGWNGGDLTIVKLRTLPTETPAYGNKHALGIAAMRLPRLCSLMRKTHLDELPQLFSVVLGQMSLIGPRPPLPNDVEPVSEDFESLRRSVRPGCTGLWQLSVASTNTATSAPRFDIYYLTYASTLLDIWILVRTVGWILGLVAPIELADVPRRLLGPGLVTPSWVRDVAEEPALTDVDWRRPKVAPSRTEVYPVAPLQVPRGVSAPDRLLAEVAD